MKREEIEREIIRDIRAAREPEAAVRAVMAYLEARPAGHSLPGAPQEGHSRDSEKKNRIPVDK